MSTEVKDIASKVRALQDAIEQATQERARALVVKERAQIKLDSALDRMRTVFNVSTLEAAKSLLAELETSLENNIQIAQDALAEAGLTND